MRVTFVLPDYSLTPVGGFRIVYGYANALVARGHSVTIIHLNLSGRGLPSWVLRTTLLRRVRPRWFYLDSAVESVVLHVSTAIHIPDADSIVATGVQTASLVAAYPLSKGRKFYLVQHFEDWVMPAEGVVTTWRLPMQKLAISHWLYREICEADGPDRVVYVGNWIDTENFRILNPPESRDPAHVGMMWSPGAFKRATDGVAALNKARGLLPDLRVTLFGTSKRPRSIPGYMRYVRSPHGEALVHLYNECAVFLHSSAAEGFPRPPAEAVACGCAVVSTRNEGVLEYLNEGNALLCQVGDVEALAKAVAFLCTHYAVRQRLTEAGTADVARLTLDAAVLRLEGVLCGGSPTTMWETQES